MRGFVRPLLGAVCLLLAGAGAPVAAAGATGGIDTPDPLQAERDTRGAVLTAVDDGGARLELAPGPEPGVSLRLPPPADATGATEYSDLALLDDGWVAAGSYTAGDGFRHLWLQRGTAAARALPEPPGRRARLRHDPALLVDGGRLAGVAWLEGQDQRSLAVFAAAWDGRGWSAPRQVAAPGPGSQLALSAAVLGDGSWLLVWSAYDGEDDEIVWSRRIGDTWLAPARLSADNPVPDITPALTVTDGGALVAWSRYDGHSYRLRLARFDGGAWGGERWAAAAGSLFPSFSGGGDRPRLLYRDARARGWSLLELDAAGVERSHASAAATPGVRPVVEVERWGRAAGVARLRWPGLGAAGGALAVELRNPPAAEPR